ncbi:unnamed protein product [Protopolystoma xenopodis]|uniref:Uncharacterized protein n=1 Tax=Protopolystoma xenopodis TaxID=117903 RepID=A0A448WF32_9PLAT|nr:unnamed protein product [Protopolystoma xenopodis]
MSTGRLFSVQSLVSNSPADIEGPTSADLSTSPPASSNTTKLPEIDFSLELDRSLFRKRVRLAAVGLAIGLEKKMVKATLETLRSYFPRLRNLPKPTGT